MKLVVRLLTEMLEVRILPGEPNLFSIKQLQSSVRAFGSGPNGWDVKRKSVVRKLLKGKFLRETCPESMSAVIKM